jgi:integrase
MSAKKETTHILMPGELLVALRERSSVWQCRYRIDGVWQRTTTGERDLKRAKEAAKQLFYKAQGKKESGGVAITRFFRDVAKTVVKRLENEIAGGNEKPAYKDYILVINKYLIPLLGKYKVDSVNYDVLAEFDEKRKARMKKEPSRSTLMTHNAALNLIFDEAVYRNYMPAMNRPELKAKGKKSERRGDFTEKEIKVLRGGFEPWIRAGRADAKPLRALLQDYVEVLLDTGARPGKELFDLKWAHISLHQDPEVRGTGQFYEEETQVLEHFIAKRNRTVQIKILTGKTSNKGGRIAIGGTSTFYAMKRIAERNYSLPIESVVEQFGGDYIFRYKEYLNKEEVASGKEAKFIYPTSFVKLFNAYLKDHDLLNDPATGKKRQFYSIRHSYATIRLLHDKVTPQVLAKQMGTSISMLEKHYDHITSIKAAHQLRGDESRQLIEADFIADGEYEYTKTNNSKKKSK